MFYRYAVLLHITWTLGKLSMTFSNQKLSIKMKVGMVISLALFSILQTMWIYLWLGDVKCIFLFKRNLVDLGDFMYLHSDFYLVWP